MWPGKPGGLKLHPVIQRIADARDLVAAFPDVTFIAGH